MTPVSGVMNNVYGIKSVRSHIGHNWVLNPFRSFGYVKK